MNRWSLPDLGVGVGLRTTHFGHILREHPAVDWFEVKAGPYVPPPPADVAGWAPAPGSPEVPRYLEHMLGLLR